jgi:hypothetical protein
MHHQFPFLFDSLIYDIVIHFILALLYYETSGQSLKQEGVYVTSLSFTH